MAVTDDDGPQAGCMALEDPERRAGRQIPQPQRIVITRGQQALAGRIESEAQHFVPMSTQTTQGATVGVLEDDGIVGTAGGDV